MPNILCTGHGTAQFGCGYSFDVKTIECTTAGLFATCPDCSVKTDLDRTFENVHPLDMVGN